MLTRRLMKIPIAAVEKIDNSFLLNTRATTKSTIDNADPVKNHFSKESKLVPFDCCLGNTNHLYIHIEKLLLPKAVRANALGS